MNNITILWIYTALLVIGGLIGYIKGKSKASIIMSIAFAIPLVLVCMGRLPMIYGLVDIGVLLAFFGYRWSKSRKMMPAGGMALLSLITLVLLHL